MNLMDYLAAGGLERLLLIGAAILITYWGYHLYSRAQIAGLAMIAVSALLLMSVVLTTGQHQQAVNANLLASVPTTEPTAPAEITAGIDSDLAAAVVPSAALEPMVEAAPEAEISAEPSPFVDAVQTAEVIAGDDTTADTPTTASEPAVADSAEPERIERLVPLASGQELGGRITSVRSENVTLEWSAGDARRRIISSSTTP